MVSTRELFIRHSLRCTQQRLAVYETLRSCEGHPTAEELFQLVRPRTRRLSLATVYNSLDALTNAGLVRRIATANGCCRFDADTSTHLHVRMLDSDDIADVPPDLGARLLGCLPPEVIEEIEREMGVRIEGISVQLEASPQEGTEAR